MKIGFLSAAFDPQAGVQRSQTDEGFMPTFSLTGYMGCANSKGFHRFCKNRIEAHNTPLKWVYTVEVQNSVSKMGFRLKFYGMGWVSSQLYDFYLEI